MSLMLSQPPQAKITSLPPNSVFKKTKAEHTVLIALSNKVYRYRLRVSQLKSELNFKYSKIVNVKWSLVASMQKERVTTAQS